MRSLRAALAATLGTLALAAPAAIAQTALPAGPDAVMSSNVEYLGSIREDVGMTTGARIVGNRMFVTSGKNISIYDITNGAAPTRVGIIKANISWENEEVPTNGKILGFGSDFYNASPAGGCVQAMRFTGCSQFFDVRDPNNIVELPAVPKANHTLECILDCSYFYGSAGTIIDATGALNGTKPPTEVGNWKTAIGATYSASCHHMREISPGIILTACRPFAVLSVLAKDGGTPVKPVVLYSGKAAKFVHSTRWPRQGTDKIVMTGGEQNFTARCDRNNSEFSTYSAEKVLAGQDDEFELLHQIVPAGNGTYTDGKPVAGPLGCSVHWFEEHASFNNGGLVALSQYEDGVRFEQIKPDGNIVEQGFFLGLGSSSSIPKWHPDGKILYSIDYFRGIDIMRWKGEGYVPSPVTGKVAHQKGAVRGTNGSAAFAKAQSSMARVSKAKMVRQLRAQGWVPGFCKLQAQRGA